MNFLEALKTGVIAHSAAAMEALGRGLAAELFAAEKLPSCVALYGDLGAGKTTLVRGLAAGLQVPNVTSPSFNYYFLYKGKHKVRPVQLLHLDAYRLAQPSDYPSLMVDELLDADTLFVIEWPEKLGEFLPKDALRLELSIVGEGVHEVCRL